MRDGWTKTAISEVADVLSGYAFKSEFFSESKGIPLIRIRDLQKQSLTEVSFVGDYDERFVVNAGDFLIGMDGEFRCYEWLGPKALLNQRVCRLQSFNDSKVVPRFIYFLVNQYLEKIEQSTSYTTVRHISVKQVKDISFPMPPITEQKRIVDVVSSVDAYIDALQKQAETARTARSAVLHELLSAGGDDWTKTTLGGISEVAYGYTESASETEVGPKFLRITDIQNDNVDWSLVPYCRIEKEKFEKQRLQNGDIVFARTGATTGKSLLILNPPPAVCASYLIRLRPIKTVVIPYFLNLNFQTEEYWMNIKSGMSGSAQGGFNASKLSSLSVSLPMLEEQKRIVEIVSSMDDVIQSTEQAVVDAKNLRSGLLSDLLSGEHEIPASYDKFLQAA
jgi:type I restriction enzyme S subunit